MTARAIEDRVDAALAWLERHGSKRNREGMARYDIRSDKAFGVGAGALLAGLAIHDKKAPDAQFLTCLPLIERAARDERNFVKKGVSWALRGIGKRNPRLRRAALRTARRLAASNDRAARWVGKDTLSDLS